MSYIEILQCLIKIRSAAIWLDGINQTQLKLDRIRTMYILTAVVSRFNWWFSSNFYYFFLVDNIMRFFRVLSKERFLLSFTFHNSRTRVERAVGWWVYFSDGPKVGEASTQNCQAKKVEGHLHLPSPFAIGSYALAFS